MTGPGLSDIPPDLDGPLTPQTWAAYRRQLNEWLHAWEQRPRVDLALLSPQSQAFFSTTWRRHPRFRGMTNEETSDLLRRQARTAQVMYRLWIQHPKPGPLTEAEQEEQAAAVVTVTEWRLFGGGRWHEMSAADLQNYVAALPSKPLGEGLLIRPTDLELNRAVYERMWEDDYFISREKNIREYIKFKRDGERYPNESNLAEFLRKSRPYAAGIAAIMFLAYALADLNWLLTPIAVVIWYLILSFLIYPITVGKKSESGI